MYATKSLSELKAIALELNVTPTGDKRSKQTWIDAIESAESVPYSNHPEELTDLCEDVWVAPEMPSDSEMESIAYAVDVLTDDSALTQTAESAPKALEPATVTEKVLDCKSNKPGAAIVVGVLVCIAILFCRTLIVGTCAIAQFGIYIVRLFGKYDPDLDLAWRLKRDRLELSPA
jgi:hypothetical protein